MKNILSLLGLIIFFSLGLSCKKKSNSETDAQKLAPCHREQHFDTLSLAGRLIGSWQWTKRHSENGDRPADKKVVVFFGADSKYRVVEETKVATQGSWHVKSDSRGNFFLSVDTTSSYLHGEILLCNEQLLFGSSNMDGFDNLFIRAN